MPIAFVCACGKTYSVPDQMAGRKSKCRQCGAELTVPTASAPPTADELAALTNAPAVLPGRYKKSRGKGKLVAGLLFTVLVLAAVGGGLAYYFLVVASPMDTAMRYVPNNPRLLFAIQVDAIRASEAWRELEAEMPERLAQLEKDVGLATADIAHVLVAGTMHDRDQPLVIIQTKKAVAASDFLSREEYVGFKETTAGKYTMYQGEPQTLGQPILAFAVPESRVVVFGQADVLRPVLERGKAPTLSLETKTLMDETDFTRPMVLLLNTRNLRMTYVTGKWTLGVQQFPGLLGFTVVVMAGKPNTLTVVATSDTPSEAKQGKAKMEELTIDLSITPGANKDLIAILNGIKWRTDDKRVLGTGQPNSVNLFRLLFGPGKRPSKPAEGTP